jgi:hypothetical protein
VSRESRCHTYTVSHAKNAIINRSSMNKRLRHHRQRQLVTVMGNFRASSRVTPTAAFSAVYLSPRLHPFVNITTHPCSSSCVPLLRVNIQLCERHVLVKNAYVQPRQPIVVKESRRVNRARVTL